MCNSLKLMTNLSKAGKIAGFVAVAAASLIVYQSLRRWRSTKSAKPQLSIKPMMSKEDCNHRYSPESWGGKHLVSCRALSRVYGSRTRLADLALHVSGSSAAVYALFSPGQSQRPPRELQSQA